MAGFRSSPTTRRPSRKLFSSRIEANFVEQTSKRGEEQQITREEEEEFLKTSRALDECESIAVSALELAQFQPLSHGPRKEERDTKATSTYPSRSRSWLLSDAAERHDLRDF